MNAHRILGLLFAAYFLHGAACLADPDAAKIGIILPMTGEAASIGETVKNAMLLALEDLPAATRSKLDLTWEDDACEPKNSISALLRLERERHLDALFNVSSGTGKALAPVAEQQHLPFLSIASDFEIASGKDYVTLLWVAPEDEVKTLIPEAVRRGYKNIARITTVQSGMLAMKTAFDALNASRLKVLLDEDYPADIKDFRSFLAKVRANKNIDAVLVLLMPGQSGLFARQARASVIKLPLFAIEIFEDASEVADSGGALIGQWYVNADDPSEEFFRRFRQRYPNSSLFGAAAGYDAMKLLGAAVDRGTSRENINRYLHTVKNFPGALGVFSSSGDNRFTLPAAVKEVTPDGFRKLSATPSETAAAASIPAAR